ncbi:peptide chain release factor N(5)-glutamine methyltransferase [Bifidobacterium eulemuris]|uniref:Release factor glutamine methyltransferase n=1 Tax=Bifidobacterium eulemuris TaxID=1765219 RepID=A0A261GBW0_9BIFI|nr:peptide chain release factor N(5)-glutamine methyltransferase [Bifidobacterium eulemuris]OZG68655.1 protein-(glutamine-N5) methyltransferase, release factor-specific [Bifidobacterium eulemuris]QOL32770.1 peptide chain release factor N(5)-glutamine methyltransferase [Bifidobacterium eulemuris]
MIDPTNTTQPVADTIRAAARTLREAGIETPEHDAKLLLAEAHGCEPCDVDKAGLMGERWSDAAADRRFASFIARRAAREPLQHITGHAPFRYLDLKVGPGVFIPRPETETVVQAGLDWITQQGLYSPRVVDLCAGSGAIGLSVVTEVPGSQVWAVELSDRTAEWTRRNLADTAKRYPSIASNYQLEVADATDATTLAHLDGTIDLVITNPPYVPLSAVPEQPEVRDHDPALALYGGSTDGTLIPERIIERAWRLLRDGGALVMEHDVSQGDQLAGYAHSVGFVESRTERDWTGRERYLFAVR